MSDIYCRMCSEPYGEPRLDMTKWEYDLFMAGAGCPCCEGYPDKKWELAEDGSDIAQAAANGDGCPIERLDLFEPSYKPPKWERPADPILWTCKGCGVQVIRNVDDNKLEYNVPYGSKAHGWYNSHPFGQGEPEETPRHVFKPDEPVCEFCYDECKGCGAPVCGNLEYGDPYEAGYCATLPNYGYQDLYCIECIGSTCSKCDSLPDDCDCCPDCDQRAAECECQHCQDCGEKEKDCECEDKGDE